MRLLTASSPAVLYAPPMHCRARNILQREDVEREECLTTILSVLGVGPQTAIGPDGNGSVLIAFNLFALEAWHIAEALGVLLCRWCTAPHAHGSVTRRWTDRCAAAGATTGSTAVCLNAYLIPYPPPSSFERQLERLAPGLIDRLRDSEPGRVGWCALQCAQRCECCSSV